MIRIVIHILRAFLLTLVVVGSATAQNDKRISYALLVDNTGSLRSQFADVLLISHEILDRIPYQSIGSIFNFNTHPESPKAVIAEGIGWTKERVVLNNTLAAFMLSADKRLCWMP